jgi:hypothetical protein
MTDRDNIVQLRQYGRGGWQDTKGQIYKAIMAGREFESGKMAGRTDASLGSGFMFGAYGELPEEWQEIYHQDQPDYVVFSYRTPIAWHVPDDSDDGGERWVVPDIKYSATTTRHQRLVLTALVFNKTEPIERLEDA